MLPNFIVIGAAKAGTRKAEGEADFPCIHRLGRERQGGRRPRAGPQQREIGQKSLPAGPPSASAPAREVSRPASLLAIAAALSRDSRIAKTYCIPAA